MSRRRVAVLGAGIMGCSVAIQLARRGFDVTVFDREPAPMAAASRWNEGKIHLGYIYGADPTLATAQHLLTGGLLFADRLRELIDADLDDHVTADDDIYLVHRDSVVGPEALRPKFDAISALVREHPDASRYLVDVSDARTAEIAPDELRTLAGADIVAGFRVPERSVDTQWVADRLAAAAASTTGVTFRLGTAVVGVEALDGTTGEWRVRTADGPDEDFDLVVNALWNGRLPIDVTAGLTPEPPWTHRYRQCVFVRTRSECDLPSALVAVGPFGDVKNYNGRDFYVSWYPVGLVGQGVRARAGRPAAADRGRGRGVHRSRASGARTAHAGDRAGVRRCRVHRRPRWLRLRARHRLSRRSAIRACIARDRYGVQRRGSYYSVDTGKYSTAPWLARELATEIAG